MKDLPLVALFFSYYNCNFISLLRQVTRGIKGSLLSYEFLWKWLRVYFVINVSRSRDDNLCFTHTSVLNEQNLNFPLKCQFSLTHECTKYTLKSANDIEEKIGKSTYSYWAFCVNKFLREFCKWFDEILKHFLLNFDKVVFRKNHKNFELCKQSSIISTNELIRNVTPTRLYTT